MAGKKTSKKKLTKKFPAGKKMTAKKLTKLVGHREPDAIVLDRVAKTFAYLQEERERSGDPIIEADSMLEHTDARGSIFNIIHEPIGAVALITSKPNTVRANHYHKEDAHLCYVVSGSIEYYERPVGSKEDAKKYTIKAGGAFYTGPLMEHAMYFPEQTTFITLGRLSRTPSEYEKDLVRLRIPLAKPEAEVSVPVPVEPPATPPPAETATAPVTEA